MEIAIVVAKFNPELTSMMEKEAMAEAKKRKVKVQSVVRVPGCFEIPLAASRLLKTKRIDAVVCLGAIITGGTGHDELIAHAVAKELLDESLDANKPVGLGILGPKISWAQAKARAKDYAIRSTNAAIDRVLDKK